MSAETAPPGGNGGGGNGGGGGMFSADGKATSLAQGLGLLMQQRSGRGGGGLGLNIAASIVQTQFKRALERQVTSGRLKLRSSS